MTNLTFAQEVKPDPLTIDHVLISVENLETAKKEYESYGFTVIYGGEKKALNALIFLKDGTLIELIGKDRFPTVYKFLNSIRVTLLLGSMKDRITTFPKVRHGFFNYCLFSQNLNETYQYLKQKDIDADKPKEFGRYRDDGVYIKWKLIGTKPFDIPFIIGNYTPGRVSDPAFFEHKNKAIALDTISIQTVSLNEYINIYNTLYRQHPKIEEFEKIKMAHYKVGKITVTLIGAERIDPFFNKNLSMTKSFTVKCEQVEEKGQTKLNQFIKLVR